MILRVVAVILLFTTTVYAANNLLYTGTEVFTTLQTLPVGVHVFAFNKTQLVRVMVKGGGGGLTATPAASYDSYGGSGGTMLATYAVRKNEVWTVVIGQRGLSQSSFESPAGGRVLRDGGGKHSSLSTTPAKQGCGGDGWWDSVGDVSKGGGGQASYVYRHINGNFYNSKRLLFASAGGNGATGSAASSPASAFADDLACPTCTEVHSPDHVGLLYNASNVLYGDYVNRCGLGYPGWTSYGYGGSASLSGSPYGFMPSVNPSYPDPYVKSSQSVFLNGLVGNSQTGCGYSGYDGCGSIQYADFPEPPVCNPITEYVDYIAYVGLKCVCLPGYTNATGTGCDCPSGTYGVNCTACPVCSIQHQVCSDGASGSGQCECEVGTLNQNNQCDCSPGFHGMDCSTPDTYTNAYCDWMDWNSHISTGMNGTGLCVCNEGMVFHNDTNYCDCPSFTFGPLCNMTCPDCTPKSVCIGGQNVTRANACQCLPGYQRESANHLCDCYPGFWGPDCEFASNVCNTLKNERSHDGINGTGQCICNDRMTNYTTTGCDCSPFTYGFNCTSDCPCRYWSDPNVRCFSGQAGNGTCGCAGSNFVLVGQICECANGFYGSQCQYSVASTNCGLNAVARTGLQYSPETTCTCLPFMTNTTHSNGDQYCDCMTDLLYGSTCTSTCACDQNQQCNNTYTGDGYCSCVDPWHVKLETGECGCSNGTYGMYCNVTCPSDKIWFNDLSHDGHCICADRFQISINGSLCVCPSGFTGVNCTVSVDDCLPNPCQNGGTCLDGLNSYTCICASGYNGVNCTDNTNDCNPNPCYNGATCSDGINSYTCHCSTGFSGVNCSTVVDGCSNYVCQNGGTCTSILGSPYCQCVAGFSGENCTVNNDDCTPNPCKNEATCQDGIHSYVCQCTVGFNGVNCTNNVDDCVFNPCRNGATCVDGSSGNYLCICTSGYNGVNCSNIIDNCASLPCRNGGICSTGIGNYSCECTAGYTGVNCTSLIPCMVGQYQQIPETASCTQCEPGRYSAYGNTTTCFPCEQGSFAAASGSSRCETCSIGRFSNNTGLPECYECPMGTTNYATGSTSCMQIIISSTGGTEYSSSAAPVSSSAESYSSSATPVSSSAVSYSSSAEVYSSSALPVSSSAGTYSSSAEAYSSSAPSVSSSAGTYSSSAESYSSSAPSVSSSAVSHSSSAEVYSSSTIPVSSSASIYSSSATPAPVCEIGSGLHGPDCTPCACPGDSLCRDGNLRDGSCYCSPGFAGENCDIQCDDCDVDSAVCRDGTTGDGTCRCLNLNTMQLVSSTQCDCIEGNWGVGCLSECDCTDPNSECITGLLSTGCQCKLHYTLVLGVCTRIPTSSSSSSTAVHHHSSSATHYSSSAVADISSSTSEDINEPITEPSSTAGLNYTIFNETLPQSTPETNSQASKAAMIAFVSIVGVAAVGIAFAVAYQSFFQAGTIMSTTSQAASGTGTNAKETKQLLKERKHKWTSKYSRV